MKESARRTLEMVDSLSKDRKVKEAEIKSCEADYSLTAVSTLSTITLLKEMKKMIAVAEETATQRSRTTSGVLYGDRPQLLGQCFEIAAIGVSQTPSFTLTCRPARKSNSPLPDIATLEDFARPQARLLRSRLQRRHPSLEMGAVKSKATKMEISRSHENNRHVVLLVQ